MEFLTSKFSGLYIRKISNALKLDELNFLVSKWYTLLPYTNKNIFHEFLVFPVLKFRKFASTKSAKSLMGEVTPVDGISFLVPMYNITDKKN